MRNCWEPGLVIGIGLAIGAVAISPEGASAAGFQVRTGSPDWIANAFAGMAAKGYDASTAWSNPAAMTLLGDNELEGGLNLILPNIQFTGENLVGSMPTPGITSSGNAATAAPTASLAGVWSASPDLKLGFSLEEPFGQRESYPFDWVGRYQALVSSVTDIELGLVAAYRIDEHLSLGAGPIVDYFQARLTNAINLGPLTAVAGEPSADLHAHNWSAGYHLGALYEFAPQLRAGIDYRSRINEDLAGEQRISIPPLVPTFSPIVDGLLEAANGHAHTSITLPDVLTTSGVWDISPEWTGLATAMWTDWSLLRQLTVTTDNGLTTSTVPLQLRNTWLGSLGANYRPATIPGLMLQAGLGFDESTGTDSTRTPRLPGRDLIQLGVGFTYEILPNASLQAAFLHEFGVGARSIDYSSSPSAGTLIGSYSTSASVISVGLNLRF
jgi:long-chain fatty acid transport protein